MVPHYKQSRYELFFTSLHQTYPEIPLISEHSANELLLVPITINFETVFITMPGCYERSTHFNYDFYLAVASLQTVQKIIEDFRRLATRANFLCIQVPAELFLPLNRAESPLFYSYEIVLNLVNLDYFCLLMDGEFYRIADYSQSYIGYVDNSLKRFVQVSLVEQVIRLKEENEEDSLDDIIYNYKEICELMDSMLNHIELFSV